MSDGIMLTIGDDGEATLYDDTYDITIHCESKEEQDEVRKALENIPQWIPVTEATPTEDNKYWCTFAGYIEADCPKWECDNPTMDCENCEFLKEYKKGVTE